MADVVIRGVGGLVEGVELSVATGGCVSVGRGDGADLDLARTPETWRLLERDDPIIEAALEALPPVVLRVRPLGEGRVAVEALEEGVEARGRTVDDRRVLDVSDAPIIVTFGGGERLELSYGRLETAGATLPATGAAEAGAPDEPDEPGRELQLEPAAAPPPPPAVPGWSHAHARELRRRLGRRRMGPVERQSRSFAASLGFHAVVALLFGLYLATKPPPDPRDVVKLTMSQAPPVDLEDPEAALGRDDPLQEPGLPVPLKTSELPESLSEAFNEGVAEADVGVAFDADMADVAIGASGAASGSYFAGRTGGKRALLRSGGGDSDTEGALHRALQWLADHQMPDGTWSAKRYTARCQGKACSGPGQRHYVAACTGAALLPFLGAGHTHRGGPWKKTVSSGLRALIRRQNEDGSFSGGEGGAGAYGNAIATLALAEAYGLTGSRQLREPLQRAVDYWVKSQGHAGGWRYYPTERASDSSVTGWVSLALVSARKSGAEVPARTLVEAMRWFAGRVGKDGSVGYTTKGGGSPALLGVGYFAQVMLGKDPKARSVAKIATRLGKHLPTWTKKKDRTSHWGAGDPIHWYYGGLAAYQRGGSLWSLWEKRLRKVLLENQETKGHANGSWRPQGYTGTHGGRVVMTALSALCLEIYYRYPRATSFR